MRPSSLSRALPVTADFSAALVSWLYLAVSLLKCCSTSEPFSTSVEAALPAFVVAGLQPRAFSRRRRSLHRTVFRLASINLDTHVREAQHQLEVSPFEARLPLRTPWAVSLTSELPIERQEGSTSSAPIFSARGARSFVRLNGPHAQDRRGSTPQHSSSTRSVRGPFLLFSKRRSRNVRTKQSYRPSSVCRTLE